MDSHQTGDGEVAVAPAGPTPRFQLEDPVKYGQDHELTVDFQAATYEWEMVIFGRLWQKVPPLKNGEFTTSRHLTEGSIPYPRVPDDVPQDIHTERSTSFLSKILSHSEGSPPLISMRVEKAGNIRLEMPVIASNNNLDLEWQSREVRKKLSTSLMCHNLPLQPIDVQKDQAIEMPAPLKAFWRILENPAYIISLDTKACSSLPDGHELKDIEAALRSSDGEDLANQLLEDQNNLLLSFKVLSTPYTPILAPTPLDDELFIPSIEASHIGYMSDLVSLDTENLKQAEESLQADEVPNCDVGQDGNPQGFVNKVCTVKSESMVELASIDIVMLDIDSPAAAGVTEGLRASDPIFPRSSSPSSIFDPEHICEAAKDNDVLTYAVASDDDCRAPQNRFAHEHFFDDEFQVIADARAEEIEKELTQEKFQFSGNNLRLLIPCMVFDIQPPDWQKKPETPQAYIGRLVADRSALPWRVDLEVSLPDKKKLRWTPFAHGAGRLAVDMPIQIDKDGLTGFFTGYESPHISDMAAERMGDTKILKGLEQLSDDEELAATFSDLTQRASAESLLSEGHQSRTKRKRLCSLETSTAVKRQRGNPSIRTKPNAPSLLIDPGKANTAGDLLSSYLSLHAPETMTPTPSLHFAAPVADNISPRVKVPEKDVTVIGDEPAIGNTPAPSPQFKISSPGRFIISLSLGIPLARRIEKRYPGVELLDRDYTKDNTLVWSPGSIRSASVPSPLSFEADIAVSPATGIIVTTLAKARQKPVPGGEPLTQLRERISKVSKLYERLIVVVSEGSQNGEFSRKMSVDDARAFADIVAFGTALNGTTRVVYVGGGEDTLANWIVAFVCKHNHETDNTRQVAMLEETTWERFLRLAGMNVYGAQVLIATLKGSGQGLVEFLQMTEEERIQRYGPLFGGRRVLQRVSAVLDRKWGMGLDEMDLDI